MANKSAFGVSWGRAIAAAAATIMSSATALAHCPLCTAAVGTIAISLGFIGISYSVLGIFVGAFAASTGMMLFPLARRISKRIGREYEPYIRTGMVAAAFLATVLPVSASMKHATLIPVYVAGEPGSLLNRTYWANTVLLFSFVGLASLVASSWLHRRIKERVGILFPYQGIATTVAMLLLVSGFTMVMGW